MIDRRLHVGHGLRLDALSGVHDEQRPFAGGETARHFIGKIHVAGSVDQVQRVIQPVFGAVVEAHRAGFDGDAALALEIHRVEHLRGHLALAERAGKLEQAIGQGGLAVVDVRDNAKIPDVLGIHGSLACLAAPNAAEMLILPATRAPFKQSSVPQIIAPGKERGE